MTFPRVTTDSQDELILAKTKPDAALAALFDLTKKQIIDRRRNLHTRSRKRGRTLLKSKLEGREAEVRELIRCGLWMPQMAERLNVSLGTVAGFIYRRKLRTRLVSRFDDPRVML